MSGDKLVVWGGVDEETDNPSVLTHIYNTQTKLWATGPPMPGATRKYAAGTIMNQTLYVCGGAYNDNQLTPSTICQYFDLRTGKWGEMPPLVYNAKFHIMAAVRGKLWVFGTRTGVYAERYEPSQKKWVYHGSANFPRAMYRSAATISGDNLYACGGTDNSGESKLISQTYAYCYKFFPDTYRWKQIASMNRARKSFSLVALDGKIYAVGGDRTLRSVEEYDPAADEWTLLPPLKERRYALSAVKIGSEGWTPQNDRPEMPKLTLRERSLKRHV